MDVFAVLADIDLKDKRKLEETTSCLHREDLWRRDRFLKALIRHDRTQRSYKVQEKHTQEIKAIFLSGSKVNGFRAEYLSSILAIILFGYDSVPSLRLIRSVPV